MLSLKKQSVKLLLLQFDTSIPYHKQQWHNNTNTFHITVIPKRDDSRPALFDHQYNSYTSILASSMVPCDSKFELQKLGKHVFVESSYCLAFQTN